MRICMLGNGRMAALHSQTLSPISGVVLDTVVGRPGADSAVKAFAVEHGYEHASTDLAATLGQADIDAVVVTTPNELHAVQTEQALRAGKHVLCEIPLALSYAEVDMLGELADSLNLCLMLCHTERFEVCKIALRERIRNGELHVRHIVGRYHLLRRGYQQTAPGRGSWLDSLHWHHGAHTVDAIFDLLGSHDVHDLGAVFGPPHPHLGVPLDTELHWRTGEGVLVSVSLSHNAIWHNHDYQLLCDEDTFVCSHGALLTREGTIMEAGDRPVLGQDDQRTFDLQNAEFVNAVQAGRRPAVDVEAIRPAMRVLQGAWDMRPRRAV